MPKVTILPQQRVFEFPESGFQVYDNRLYCPFCNEFLDHMKKCVIKAHAVSRKHAKSKSDHYQQQQAFGIVPINPLMQAQMSQNTYEMSRIGGVVNVGGCVDYSASKRREESTSSGQKKKKPKKVSSSEGNQRETTTTTASVVSQSTVDPNRMISNLVDVKMPIAVFEDQRFRFWLKDNLEYELPKKPIGTTFYDDGVSAVDLENTVAECLDRDVCIVLDDTMDTGESGLIAVNVFVSPLGESFNLKLVATQFLETYDSDSAFRLTVSALESARIDGKNVVVLVSSNSEYLVKVGDLLKQFCPRLHCFPCWGSILAAVINEVRSQCTVLDQLAFAVDTALKADPKQRQALVLDLKQHQQQQQHHQSSRDGGGGGRVSLLLPYLVSSKRPFVWLRVVFFLCEHFDWLKGWITTMNETGLNQLRLKDLVCRDQTKELLNRFRNISFGLKKVFDEFEKGTLLPSRMWSTMCEVANLFNKEGFAIPELKIRLESMLPSSGFWKIVEMLDPRMITYPNSNLATFVRELYFFGAEPVPVDEIQRYEKTVTVVHGAKTMSPIQFWKTCSDQMPTMSRLALKVMSVPLSTSFVEKTFSVSKSWNFSSGKSDALALDMRLFFNSKQSVKEVNGN